MIYLDDSATTKPTQEVINDIQYALNEIWANPSSPYKVSDLSRKILEEARENIAKSIDASPDEIYFTSGGSESNNWAIRGVCEANNIDVIITTAIEHPSIYNVCEYLKTKNIDVQYVPVNSFGKIDIYEFEKMLYKYGLNKKVLVSIMYSNNEIGTIQDVSSIAYMCSKIGAIFHTDAVQAYTHVNINVKKENIDLMSVSGHKFGCPKGIGFLYKRNGIDISPLIYGGHQENGLRAGTENLPYIYAMGNRVKRLFSRSIDDYIARIAAIRDILINNLCDNFYCYLNGSYNSRICNNVNVTLYGINAEKLITLLGMRDIYVSAGSACCSGEATPSRVLKAIGLSDDDAFNTIRITVNYNTTIKEIDEFIKNLQECIIIIDKKITNKRQHGHS